MSGLWLVAALIEWAAVVLGGATPGAAIDGLAGIGGGVVFGAALATVRGVGSPGRGILRRALGLAGFLGVFAVEFVRSNLSLAWVVLAGSNRNLRPTLLTYDISDLSRLEFIVLSHCITLTPGTTSVQVLEQERTLLLHALHTDDPGRLRQQIDQGLKRALLRWSR